jgi:hypothetical protein
MADKQAHLEYEEVMAEVCSECGREEPTCDGKKCNSRELQVKESFVCVDGGDFHFCKKCAKRKVK